VGAMTPFDLVIILALLAMFVVGYAQGITRRLLGIGAILFSLGLGATLRTPFGGYLAGQWTSISPEYAYMFGFGAVFVAAAIALSFGIQISYRPAPLLYRYPVLDEILGGCLGVVEGLLIFMAVLIIIDPYFRGIGAQTGAVNGEFGLLRSLSTFIDDSVFASVMRENIIPSVFVVFGWLFPKEVVDHFTAIVLAFA
jgi:uncharacterized membrane protein required for colicin V production